MRHLLRENGNISPSDERSKGGCEGFDRRLRKVAEIDKKTPIDSEIVGFNAAAKHNGSQSRRQKETGFNLNRHNSRRELLSESERAGFVCDEDTLKVLGIRN